MKKRTLHNKTNRAIGKSSPAIGPRAKLKGISLKRVVQTQTVPRTANQYSALSAEAQEQWNRVAHVIQKMRTEGISVTRAAREFGIDRKEVIELGGSALRKQKNGRYTAKPFDRLLRVLVMPSADGLREVAVRDSRTASKIAEYSDAVQKYLRTGDSSALKTFKRLKLVNDKGERISFLTDVPKLQELGSAGVLSFESLYARVA
jgi:hypothetical protein